MANKLSRSKRSSIDFSSHGDHVLYINKGCDCAKWITEASMPDHIIKNSWSGLLDQCIDALRAANSDLAKCGKVLSDFDEEFVKKVDTKKKMQNALVKLCDGLEACHKFIALEKYDECRECDGDATDEASENVVADVAAKKSGKRGRKPKAAMNDSMDSPMQQKKKFRKLGPKTQKEMDPPEPTQAESTLPPHSPNVRNITVHTSTPKRTIQIDVDNIRKSQEVALQNASSTLVTVKSTKIVSSGERLDDNWRMQGPNNGWETELSVNSKLLVHRPSTDNNTSNRDNTQSVDEDHIVEVDDDDDDESRVYDPPSDSDDDVAELASWNPEQVAVFVRSENENLTKFVSFIRKNNIDGSLVSFVSYPLLKDSVKASVAEHLGFLKVLDKLKRMH